MKGKKLTTLISGICLVLILIALPIVAACAKPAPAPAPTPAPAPAPAPKKTFTIKFPDMGAPGTARCLVFEWWGEQLNQRTNGQIKVEYYWGSSLLKPYEQLEAVQTGSVQVSAYYAAYHPDIAPLPGMALSPFVNTDSYLTAMYAAHEWFNTNEHLLAEFKKNNVHYLYPGVFAGQNLWSKVPINRMEDLKGLRVRSYGPFLALFEALGSALVDVSVAEVYDALERGAVDVSTFPADFAVGFHLYEVTKYGNLTDFGKNVGSPVVVNIDFWNELPDDVKAVFEELNQEILDKTPEFFLNREKDDLQFLKDKGMIFSELPPEDVTRIMEITKTEVWEKYNKDVEQKKGIPASEVFKNYQDLIAKYKQKYG